ncbi:hypothetical protein S40293_00698 [Stachybotrys chartarum IBT 40293]|nr:hypothetical protein S40293_00698 [Stachybotrys chartarum IBT 40293]
MPTMPDLNSVPASPHSLVTSRRQSANQAMPPPAPQSSSLNILPSNQSAVGQSPSATQTSPQQPPPSQPAASSASPNVDSGVGSGPGPLRHPRPLTATELHMQLEKEQEAVVNRLTRELSILRTAQNASVVSNTSSTSGTTSHDLLADQSSHFGTGFTIPTTRRHHRTSSAASQLASSYEARAQAIRPQPASLSRQNSVTRLSQTASPIPPTNSLDPSSYFLQQRVPPSTSISMSSIAATPGSTSNADQLSPGMLPATTRYEETAMCRAELEMAKKENETLKRRIRELERAVRERRASDASRTRSESVSTTASFSMAAAGGAAVAGPRDVGLPLRPERERSVTTHSTTSVAVGVPEDEVAVGESAASSGLGNK